MTDIATPAFTLNDVLVGKTVLRGRSTTGALVSGTVSRILPGIAFEVLVELHAVLLWREFEIVPVAAGAAAAADTGGQKLPVPGELGFPDCDFWEALGIPPLFVATASNYFDWEIPTDPNELKQILVGNRDVAESLGGAYLAAWTRQMRDADILPVGPENRFTGPEDRFIKPDPLLTRQETRSYLLEEMERYLTGSIVSDALTLHTNAVSCPSEPAERLYRLHQLLEKDGKLPVESVELQMAHVARWVLSVIMNAVTAATAVTAVNRTDAEKLAMEFWEVDLLPNKKTIGSYWNYSPFEALRSAPPLTEVDDTVAPLPLSDDEVDYSDMPALIPASEVDYSDMNPVLTATDEEDEEEEEDEEDFVAYNHVSRFNRSMVAIRLACVRNVTVPTWLITLLVAIVLSSLLR